MFKVRPTSDLIGRPLEAASCPCLEHQLIHDETCVFCGLFPLHTIRATWAAQAEEAARLGRRGRLSCRPVKAVAA